MWRVRLCVLTGVVVITGVMYHSLWTDPFVYEDDAWIRRVGQPMPTTISLPGRSVTMATLQATWAIVGLEPRAYHLGNLGLHLLVALVVWRLARQVLKDEPAAIGAALIFLWHPLQREAVNYVAARADLLATLGIVTAVWLSLARARWSESSWGADRLWQMGRALLVGACLLLALASKESAVVGVPLVLWTRWGTEGRRSTWRPPAVVGSLVLAGLVLWGWPKWQDATEIARPAELLWGLPSLQALAVWRYVQLVIWPVGFTVDHDFLLFPLILRPLAVLGWVCAALGAWRLRRRAPWLLWGVGWLLIAVGPRWGLRVPAETLTEPQFYLPMVGVSLMAGWILTGLCQWRRPAVRPVALWTTHVPSRP